MRCGIDRSTAKYVAAENSDPDPDPDPDSHSDPRLFEKAVSRSSCGEIGEASVDTLCLFIYPFNISSHRDPHKSYYHYYFYY